MLLASDRPLWREVGAQMIAIDTLVHNFLHRTGVLSRFAAEHSYGEACYRPGACADVIREVASTIDASQFNRTYPRSFPRFVQNAIWRHCAETGFNECNGNRIDDRQRCENGLLSAVLALRIAGGGKSRSAARATMFTSLPNCRSCHEPPRHPNLNADPKGPRVGPFGFQSQTATKPDTQQAVKAGPAVVVFGKDEEDKARAARFRSEEAELAIKAAGSMKLRILKIATPEMEIVASQLPLGRIYASGLAFGPEVQDAFLTRLQELAEPKAAPVCRKNGTQSTSVISSLPRKRPPAKAGSKPS